MISFGHQYMIKSLTVAPVVFFFDSVKPTHLCIDASRNGLGFVLQQQSDGLWTLIQAGSNFLTETESIMLSLNLSFL